MPKKSRVTNLEREGRAEGWFLLVLMHLPLWGVGVVSFFPNLASFLVSVTSFDLGAMGQIFLATFTNLKK